MRFFAFIVLVALAIVVSAAPRNVPQFTPQDVIDFDGEQSSNKEKRTFDEFGSALSSWLSPAKVCSR
jgi:hypothetical protein